MKRKTLLIAAGFVLLAVIILAVYFINTPKQTVSYKKSMLTDNISSFETAAKTAMALYEDGNEDGVWLFTVDTDANNLACYNGYEHLL